MLTKLTLTRHASIQKLLHGHSLLSDRAYRTTPPKLALNWLFTPPKSCLKANLTSNLRVRFSRRGLDRKSQILSSLLRTWSKTTAPQRLRHDNLNLNLNPNLNLNTIGVKSKPKLPSSNALPPLAQESLTFICARLALPSSTKSATFLAKFSSTNSRNS